ncbi:MAG TPA: hypothetical protein VN738_02490 [Acidothermaceae bacterium]|nr:hypothetical protein [Acidothermaceae bacterium]
MSTKRVHRLFVAGVTAIAIGTMAVGCSSNSPKSTAAGSTATASATALATDTAAASDTAAPTSSAPSVKPGSGKGSSFCKELEQVAAYTNSIGDDATDTPDQMKKSIELYNGVKSSLEKSAPAEIKADLTTLFNYLDQIYGAIAKANYDFTKLDPTVLASLSANEAQIQAAGDHVTQYVQTACGINLDSASPSS